MIEEYFRRRPHLHQVLSTPAGPYLEGLATHLVRQGFSRWKLRQRLHGAAHFSLWRGMSGGALDQLHEEALPAFAKHLRSCECPGRFRRSAHSDGSAVAGAIELVQHLRWLGVVRLPAPAVAPSTEPELVRGFSEWMRHCRCVKDNTLRGYIRVILEVLDVLGDSPKDYTARSLRAFVLKTTDGATRSMGKQVVTAMRHFLRYLIAHGQCDVGLDGAIPTLAMWRLSALPRYLPAAEVQRIIDACDNRTAMGLRDRAVLLLLARLGLRAGDIATLGLEDIDWQQSSIRVAGKSRTELALPLTHEVGAALLKYLTHGRPAAGTDRVFVRVIAPWGPLRVSSVSALVARAMERAGVESQSRGAHVLRHSAATEMLRQGATLDQIGAVLRHQHLDTTAHYAKVDVERLREIALPWPEVTPC